MSIELMVLGKSVSGSAGLGSLSHYISKTKQLTLQPQDLSLRWKVSSASAHVVAEALPCFSYTVKRHPQVELGQKNK